MAVIYVDHARIQLGRMKMSHMMADSSDELRDAAIMLRIDPRHIQHLGTPQEHLDVCESKRQIALANGAKAVTSRELVEMRRLRRGSRPAS